MRLARAFLYVLPSLALAVGTAGVVAVSGVTTAALAAEKSQTITNQKLSKPLKAVQELTAKKKWDEAKDKLKEAEAVTDKTPYEEFVVNQFLAYISVNLKDYATAARAYEGMINTGMAPASDKAQNLKALVQLNYQIKNYPKVNKFAELYLKQIGPDVDMSLIMAQTDYLQGDYKGAAQNINEAINTSQQAGRGPKEDWLNLLMSAQYKSGDKAAVAKTLEVLVEKFPAQKYWKDLLGGLQGQSGLTDRQNFEIYRLKYATGVLEGANEYVEMAELALQLGLPGDAKTVLKKGFDSGLLGTGANKSREIRLQKGAETQADADQKVLPRVEKEAAAKPTGDALVKLAEAFASYGQSDKAVDLYKQGIAKGSLKDEDLAELDMGVALAAAHKDDQAIAAFKQVSKSSKYSSVARLWRIKIEGSR
jgi:hypothetical protein